MNLSNNVWKNILSVIEAGAPNCYKSGRRNPNPFRRRRDRSPIGARRRSRIFHVRRGRENCFCPRCPERRKRRVPKEQKLCPSRAFGHNPFSARPSSSPRPLYSTTSAKETAHTAEERIPIFRPLRGHSIHSPLREKFRSEILRKGGLGLLQSIFFRTIGKKSAGVFPIALLVYFHQFFIFRFSAAFQRKQHFSPPRPLGQTAARLIVYANHEIGIVPVWKRRDFFVIRWKIPRSRADRCP